MIIIEGSTVIVKCDTAIQAPSLSLVRLHIMFSVLSQDSDET